MSSHSYVFGYGSLIELGGGVPAVPARLPGWRRAWGVAMDNRHDLPGYKVFYAPDGSRPAVHVCFLDVRRVVGAEVTGLCLAVDPAVLPALDARERNYDRVDVTREVLGTPAGAAVWTYVGTRAGRARLRAGRAAGTAVIARSYLETVCAGFRWLGEPERAAARASLNPGQIPVVDLVRRELG